MSRARQLSFLPPPRLDHGGEVRKGKRKLARPVDHRRPLHLTLRSTQAKGAWSLLKHKNMVYILVHEIADACDVKVHQFVNVGNHLHLLVSVPSRAAFQSFLRRLTGAIVFAVTGCRKGHALKRRFWDFTAWSRVVSWGWEFRAVKTYLAKNLLESFGIDRSRLGPLPGS